MTLKLKRKIVQALKGGHVVGVWVIEMVQKDNQYGYMRPSTEAALRDYLNGKFSLEPKKRVRFVPIAELERRERKGQR